MAEATPQRIRLVLPDAGPLISLAAGDALDLLLLARPGVRLVVTDLVHYEVTHRHAELQDGAAILDFVQRNASRIEVAETTVGRFAVPSLKARFESGQREPLPKDLGELSITSFITSMRTHNPGDPTLVIIEDDWFESNSFHLPGNVHLISTAAFLSGLEAARMIPSAAQVMGRIRDKRPGFRAQHLVDRPADKIPEGTSWLDSFERPKS